MKILHINSYYSTSLFYKNLYENQINEGLKIDVFVPVPYSFEGKKKSYGEYSKLIKNHSKHDRFIFHLKQKRITDSIDENYNLTTYNLTHAHSLFTNGHVALKLKKKYGIPYVVAVRNTDVNVFFKNMFLLRHLGIQILLEAEKVIFLSPSYREKVLEKYIPPKSKYHIYKNSVIIPNGIDDFWLENKYHKMNAPFDKKIKLIYVGAINRNKNILTTIKAIEILIDKGFNVEFTIVGEVHDKSIYQKIQKHSFINYVGQKSKDQLIHIYRENSIFVMPSYYESFGLVYAEAMTQGLPVIYSKNQGFDKQFNDGEVGYSVNPKSEKEISNKILDIVKNYVSLHNNCLIYCEKFSWNNITEEYKNIYNKSKNEE